MVKKAKARQLTPDGRAKGTMILSYSYSNSLVYEIKARISIQEVFEQCFPGTKVIKRGNRLWSRCPFHDERTPSFFLDVMINRFSCYGCHIHGDQIDLYAKARNLETREAIKQLAYQLGINRHLSPQEKRRIKSFQYARAKQASIDADLEKTILQARLDCWEMERWLYTLKNHIYDERDLDRPGPVFALRNLTPYIEYLGDVMLNGSKNDQIRAVIAFRGWEACQKTAGLMH